MKVQRVKLSVFVIALCLLLSASLLFGQSANTSALTGTVTDQTGAVVPNATVTATNVGTNATRTVTTGADGVYRIPLLEPGNYRVRISAQGFKTAEVTAITLNVTESVTLDRSLEVGAQTEQVTVEAAVETVQTATSTLGTTVTGNTITSLPLSSRNFTQVLGMSAGVAVDVSNGSAFGRGSQNMSVNGAAPEKNNFQMDGVAINNAAGNGNAADAGLYTGIAIPNPDSIQEFKIQTSTYDASFGRNPGANVNVVTKSGTNQLHGSLFEFFRNEKLNANDFFYNRDTCTRLVALTGTCPKQVLKQNQFGGTVGGPIKKDKVFFFGSYQGTRQRNGVAAEGITNATLYPIPSGDRGTTSLSGVDNAAAANFRAALGQNMCVGGRGTGTGFATRAGTIPIACDGSNINDVAMRLLQVKMPDGSYYIPGSGITPGPGVDGRAQRLFSVPARYSENQYLANVDYVVTDKHSLQMKYMFSDNPSLIRLQGQLPGRELNDLRGNTSAVLRLTSILTPSIVNQARISFQRIIRESFDTVVYTPQQIGMRPLVSIDCCQGTTGGSYTLPAPMTIPGAFNLGGGGAPSFAPTNQTQYSEQISWTKGTHTFRAGFEYENVRYALAFGGLGRGTLVLASFQDMLIGRRACSAAEIAAGCSVANPGNTTGGTVSSFTGCQFCVRSSVNGILHNYNLRNMNAFVQDDWKVNNKLTLNIGVRWEYNGILRDKYGNLTNFWLSDLQAVPIADVPSANSVNDALATLSNNPNAYRGYVVPNNYDTRPLIQGGHGPIPPGVRVYPGEYTSQNGVPLSNFAPRIGFAWQPLNNGRLVVRGGAGIFYDRVGINRMVHAVQEGRPYADTTTIQHDIASLQSPYQDRPLVILPRWYNRNTLAGSDFNSPFYDRITTPLVRQYNLGVQYEFIRGYVWEAAYVGSSGINIANYNHIINPAALACTATVTTNCSPSVNGATTNTLTNASLRVPILGFLANGLERNAFDGVYNYNSLQTTVRKNFSRGLGFQAAYTFSRNLSNVGFGTAANLNYTTDMYQQYGQTPFSRPHRFVFQYQYQLPFRANGALNRVVNGWTISGLTTVQSGNPLTIFDTRGGGIYGLQHSNLLEDGVSRAQLAVGKTHADIPTSGGLKDRLGGPSGGPGFFNTAAFGEPRILGNDNSRDFGNSGIGIVRGPHQLNFDFSVQKETKINERHSIQFRAEFFNIFNHAQFAIPAESVAAAQTQRNAGNFGRILGTSVNPRLIQFGLRYYF
jgi:outer membrane receptor protein involved in Fe transport